MSEFSRRTFLRSAPVVPPLLAVYFTSCGKEKEAEWRYPHPELIHKAGSIELTSSQGSGHCSLIKENGRFYLYTIEHIAEYMQKDPSTSRALFSGLPPAKIDPSRFQYGRRRGNDYETVATYPLLPEASKFLEEVINRNILTYLIKSTKMPLPGERVLSPNPYTGAYTELFTRDYPEWQNFLAFEHTGVGIVCEGRSGGPILRKDGALVTNEIYGVISVGKSIFSVPDGSMTTDRKKCAEIILARPNN